MKIPPFILFLMITFGILATVSMLAPVLFPIDLSDTELTARFKPPRLFDPESEFLFGTDSLGRDVGIRLLYATRTSLIIAFLGMVLATIFGLIVGVLSGLNGGVTDHVLSFITDTQLSVPITFIGIICATMMGSDALTVIIVIGVTGWPGFARLVRSQVIQLKEAKFVESSRSIGASKTRIFFEHILTNIASPLIVYATMNLSSFILLESALSYIGLGIQPPETTLGVMVSDGRNYLLQSWWMAVIPSVLIVLLILQISLIGDWLRDKLDPKLKNKT